MCCQTKEWASVYFGLILDIPGQQYMTVNQNRICGIVFGYCTKKKKKNEKVQESYCNFISPGYSWLLANITAVYIC